jgi:hypothetical protein
MALLVNIALFGYIPLVLFLFTVLPARRAVIAGFLLGWLFLPWAKYDLAGLPPFDRVMATSLGVLIGVVIFDSRQLMSVRLGWVDLPMVVWLACPIASSVTNGLGYYDGISSVMERALLWGIPYLVGRAYFADLAGLRDLAIGLVIGGIVYTPLCLWEIVMSPRLHMIVYGFRQHLFSQTLRFGGWRPMVFMQHGIALGMFMASAALAAYWLWRSRSRRGRGTNGELGASLMGVPIGTIAIGLIVMTVICKSAFAIALLLIGIVVLESTRALRSPIPVLCLVLIAPGYMVMRTVGGWDGRQVVSLAEFINKERAFSIETRVNSENVLSKHALRKPTFGWGGHSRSLVINAKGKKEAIPDGFWVIALGTNGVIGLASITLVLLLPAVMLIRRLPARHWSESSTAPAAMLAVLLALWMLDNLLNAMLTPIYPLIAGGVVMAFSARGRAVATRRLGTTPTRPMVNSARRVAL